MSGRKSGLWPGVDAGSFSGHIRLMALQRSDAELFSSILFDHDAETFEIIFDDGDEADQLVGQLGDRTSRKLRDSGSDAPNYRAG
jgi:hypothetical protein